MSASSLYPSTAEVATGLPVHTERDISTTKSEALQTLAGFGFPRGLAAEVLRSTECFPLRLWVVDNSGSMQSTDGSRLVSLPGGRTRIVSSTRWQELYDTLSSVADMSQALQARTEFLLLNPTTCGVPQWLSVGGGIQAVDELPISSLGQAVDSTSFREMMSRVSPAGGTPLTEAVMQVTNILEPIAPTLAARGQQAVVVLATDGLPNDQTTFVAALQALQRLPVWVVIRLCTNDDNVVEYWSDLDRSLEASLEVLDDEAGEAAEIAAAGQRWLTYGPPLHLRASLACRIASSTSSTSAAGPVAGQAGFRAHPRLRHAGT